MISMSFLHPSETFQLFSLEVGKIIFKFHLRAVLDPAKPLVDFRAAKFFFFELLPLNLEKLKFFIDSLFSYDKLSISFGDGFCNGLKF